MPQLFKLNSKNLPMIPGEATLPEYDRSVLKSGIVHIGVGAFHRAHQAVYTDMLLQRIRKTRVGEYAALDCSSRTAR